MVNEEMDNSRYISRHVAADGRTVIKIFDGPCKNCGCQICKPFMDAPTCDNCGEEVALSFFDLIETVVTENPHGTLTDYIIRDMYLRNEE